MNFNMNDDGFYPMLCLELLMENKLFIIYIDINVIDKIMFPHV